MPQFKLRLESLLIYAFKSSKSEHSKIVTRQKSTRTLRNTTISCDPTGNPSLDTPQSCNSRRLVGDYSVREVVGRTLLSSEPY
ncbi:hypothetical protein K402DRAFT_390358 [Aulographum hederae CBS 113979]|uniref:Uncharacterized protein n=1 Tax=Aulographum hederae CBS 113979 TaxID=1176131 RepID=A0A6G1HAJ3_9PEZI|nr:hypothetical protein K402DRAFT_390358 [Aulographum hederae CBS 113979]